MDLQKEMNYSYWELKQYFSGFDLVVVGSGIVGLSAAISFKEKNKKATVLVLERGSMPDGASSKNAGFACFGSTSELLDDLENMNETAVWETVKMRWEGLQLLRRRLGDKNIDYQQHGGYELFDKSQDFAYYFEKSQLLNKKMREYVNIKNCYTNASKKSGLFKNVTGILHNQYEGQIDTGKMMESLLQMAHQKGIRILNSIEITSIRDLKNHVELQSQFGIFKASKVIVATNGFANTLLKLKDIKPARAQVLITAPIKNLKLKGTFHYQKGYYYFRNIDNRILFGGGRNLDFETETTTESGLNKTIHTQLDQLLKTMILPTTPFKVEHRWSGIMGIGSEKKPIIHSVSTNVVAAVRMGGMGIAIGNLVGKLAAEQAA